MSKEESSYRSVVRATGLVGGASIGVLVINLVRAKAFALLVGPAGIGLLGVLSTIVSTAAAVGGMGLHTSSVRQLARDDADERTVRLGIWTLAWLLATASCTLVWLLRTPIALAVTGDDGLSWAIGWVAIGVALTVLTATMTGVFQGLRRIGDMARTNVVGTLVGSALSIAAVYLWGELGIVASLIVLPGVIGLVGLWFMRRKPAVRSSRPTVHAIVDEWSPLIHLGLGVITTALIGAVTLLALRSLVLRELGIDQVGLLQAAFAISNLNMSLVLGAMAADYYPRLSAVGDDPGRLARLLDQQLHVTMLLSAPVLILLSAAAPLWLQILFSSEFTPAAELLRLQLLAETIRIPVWALSFVLLARRDRRGYVGNELAFCSVTILVTALLLPAVGLAAVGVGYVLGYVAAISFTVLRVRGSHGVAWPRAATAPLVLLAAACLALVLFGGRWPLPTMIAGTITAAAATVWALAELDRNDALPARLRSLLAPILDRRG